MIVSRGDLQEIVIPRGTHLPEFDRLMTLEAWKKVIMENTEAIDVWHVEYVSFDSRLWAWTPMVQVCPSEAHASAQMDALVKARNKGIQCLHVTGPHKHLLPTKWPE